MSPHEQLKQAETTNRKLKRKMRERDRMYEKATKIQHEDASKALARAMKAEAALAEARAQLEFERMRLAACGVAAMCNTPESSAKQRLESSSPYWSASYGDVCRLVDREMEQRAQLATARAVAFAETIDIVAAGAVSDFAAKWLGVVVSVLKDKYPLPPGLVVLPVETLVKVREALNQALSDWLTDAPRGLNEDQLAAALALLDEAAK